MYITCVQWPEKGSDPLGLGGMQALLTAKPSLQLLFYLFFNLIIFLLETGRPYVAQAALELPT